MIRPILSTLCILLIFASGFAQPIATFDNRTIDFGTVIEGSICKHSFKLINTGNKPLEISNVSVTCGCTVPRWSQLPIAAGDTSSVYIEFNTFNKMGNVAKGVNLTTNTAEPMIGLIILANIIPDPDFKATIDSTHFKPLRVLDQKSFYQIELPAINLNKKGYKGDATTLELMVKKILAEKDKNLSENVWYTSSLDVMVVNTATKENKILLAKLLKKEFSSKKKIKYWQTKI